MTVPAPPPRSLRDLRDLTPARVGLGRDDHDAGGLLRGAKGLQPGGQRRIPWPLAHSTFALLFGKTP